MTLNEYQVKALNTANYPDRGHNIVYPALGLVGEAGEVSEKVKKLWRNYGITDGSKLGGDIRGNELIKELGDVLWYVAALADELGVSLLTIAETNLYKLGDRANRGVIKSEGDNR